MLRCLRWSPLVAPGPEYEESVFIVYVESRRLVIARPPGWWSKFPSLQVPEYGWPPSGIFLNSSGIFRKFSGIFPRFSGQFPNSL